MLAGAISAEADPALRQRDESGATYVRPLRCKSTSRPTTGTPPSPNNAVIPIFRRCRSDMNSKWLGRLPALSGAIFAVVAFARGGGDDSAPTASSSGAQIATYAYHHGLPNSAYQVELWSFLALMVFSIVLY